MNDLKFYGLLDFYPKKERIKLAFDNLSLEEKINYKKEVYSICWEKEYIKDLIWEYLNGWTESQFDLAKEYRTKKKRVKKYESNYTTEIT